MPKPGDICSWCGTYQAEHDYQHLARECFPKRIEILEQQHRAMKSAIVQTVGGMVEGEPTHGLNYLQRLRQLVAIENAARAVVSECADSLSPSNGSIENLETAIFGVWR